MKQTAIRGSAEAIAALEEVRERLLDRCNNRCEACGVPNTFGPGSKRDGRTLVGVLYGEPTADIERWRVYCRRCRGAHPELTETGEQLELALEAS